MIDSLREWFALNRPLVYFVYGEVFFILALAIVLQARSRSRLSLARSLYWLAGFGFLHSLNEWGDLFIPIQSQFLAEPILAVLYAFQHILLAASFACLLQFGVELLRPLPGFKRWLSLLPAFLLILWLIGPFWSGMVLMADLETWHKWTDALARYFLCIPGSGLAAYGLWQQAKVQIEPLQMPRIGRTLKVAAGALAVYGLLGGLLVPQLPFFPANIINETTFSHIFIAPHPIFRSLVGIVLTVAIVRALEVFEMETERTIRQMEEAQVLAIERERIARDLHDGALQQVYAAGLLAQSLARKARGREREGMNRLVLSINQAIDQLRAFLPQLQPEVNAIELVPALEPIVEEAQRAVPVETFWETPFPPALQPEQISHLTAFTREALSNAIRHAHTRRVEVRLLCVNSALRLTIRDFGRGISPAARAGYGLRNMRDRARLLGADLKIETSSDGTQVILDLPMEGYEKSHPSADCG